MTNHPFSEFPFIVEWGESKMGFSEVSGLQFISDFTKNTDGDNSEFRKIKMPGLQKLGNITLKKGISFDDNKFLQWVNAEPSATAERRNIIIKLIQENQESVYVWKIRNAYPIHITTSGLGVGGGAIAIEVLEFAHEGLIIDAV